jgi:hypothetical protein
MTIDGAEAAIRTVIAAAVAQHDDINGRGLDALFAMRQAQGGERLEVAHRNREGRRKLAGEPAAALARLQKARRATTASNCEGSSRGTGGILFG